MLMQKLKAKKQKTLNNLYSIFKDFTQCVKSFFMLINKSLLFKIRGFWRLVFNFAFIYKVAVTG